MIWLLLIIDVIVHFSCISLTANIEIKFPRVVAEFISMLAQTSSLTLFIYEAHSKFFLYRRKH